MSNAVNTKGSRIMETASRKRAGNMFDRPVKESKLSMSQREGIALLTGEAFVAGSAVTRECPLDKRVAGKRVAGATIQRRFRDFNCCVFCGDMVAMHADLTSQHVGRGEMDRINAGESYKVENLQIACRTCNAARGNKTVGEFVAQYSGKTHLLAIAAAEAR